MSILSERQLYLTLSIRRHLRFYYICLAVLLYCIIARGTGHSDSDTFDSYSGARNLIFIYIIILTLFFVDTTRGGRGEKRKCADSRRGREWPWLRIWRWRYRRRWRQDGGGRGYAARAARIGAPQGRENGARECDEEGGCTEEGERSSERERRTCTDDPEI